MSELNFIFKNEYNIGKRLKNKIEKATVQQGKNT